MTSLTETLHRTFLDALGSDVLAHGDLDTKPLEIDLRPPLPTHIRLYMYSLVEGGASRSGEYKAVLRAPRQIVGQYASFDHGGRRLAVLAAYREDLGVFVIWDASLHARFKHGGNVQVRDTIVLHAAATGWAEQRRPLRSGLTETVYACQPRQLPRALRERMLTAGGEPTR